MKKILLDSIESYHEGYGAGEGTTEYYEYKCPCGKGRCRFLHHHFCI